MATQASQIQNQTPLNVPDVSLPVPATQTLTTQVSAPTPDSIPQASTSIIIPATQLSATITVAALENVPAIITLPAITIPVAIPFAVPNNTEINAINVGMMLTLVAMAFSLEFALPDPVKAHGARHCHCGTGLTEDNGDEMQEKHRFFMEIMQFSYIFSHFWFNCMWIYHMGS